MSPQCPCGAPSHCLLHPNGRFHEDSQTCGFPPCLSPPLSSYPSRVAAEVGRRLDTMSYICILYFLSPLERAPRCPVCARLARMASPPPLASAVSPGPCWRQDAAAACLGGSAWVTPEAPGEPPGSTGGQLTVPPGEAAVRLCPWPWGQQLLLHPLATHAWPDPPPCCRDALQWHPCIQDAALQATEPCPECVTPAACQCSVLDLPGCAVRLCCRLQGAWTGRALSLQAIKSSAWVT